MIEILKTIKKKRKKSAKKEEKYLTVYKKV